MRFDKEMTAIIKGIALIFMMLLHCYGHVHYDVELDYSFAPLSQIAGVFKICISLFAFMVGFGYSFSATRDCAYSIRHIIKLLIPFWTILIVLTFPFCWSEVLSSGWKMLLYNMVGIDSHFNYYSWFVYFFIYAMIVMPLISRFIDYRPLLNTIVVVVASTMLMYGIHYVMDVASSQPAMAVFNCMMMTPLVALGYLFGHEHYYERMNVNRLSRWVCLSLALALIVLVMWIRFYRWGWKGFQYDFFFVPLMIGSLVVIFNKFELKPLRTLLVNIGKVST